MLPTAMVCPSGLQHIFMFSPFVFTVPVGLPALGGKEEEEDDEDERKMACNDQKQAGTHLLHPRHAQSCPQMLSQAPLACWDAISAGPRFQCALCSSPPALTYPTPSSTQSLSCRKSHWPVVPRHSSIQPSEPEKQPRGSRGEVT